MAHISYHVTIFSNLRHSRIRTIALRSYILFRPLVWLLSHILVTKLCHKMQSDWTFFRRNRNYPRRQANHSRNVVENCRENGYRDSFAVRSHRDMLLRLVASAFFLRAVTTTNDAVAELSGEHAASIPRTLTSLPARCSGFIYSASFLVTRLHSRW